MRFARLALCALALVAATAVAPAAQAAPEVNMRFTYGVPTCGSLEILADTQGNTVRVYARNRYRGELTVGMTYTVTNMNQSDVAPYVVVKPGETALVGTLTVDDPRSAWRWKYYCNYRFGNADARPQPYAYKLPFRKGSAFRVMQGFNGSFSHNGDDRYAVDFDLPIGTPVLAARDGVVVAYNDRATTGGTSPAFRNDELANWILIRHTDGTVGRYYHLKPGGVKVTAGQTVQAGDWIGVSGNTGFSSAPHLHFDVISPTSAENIESVPFGFRMQPNGGVQEPKQGITYTAF